MAWHQGLSNTILNFNLHLQEVPDRKKTRERKRGMKNYPITWGQVKALSDDAQRSLDKAGMKKTPKNFIVAVIACLNANSVLIICSLILIMMPMGGTTDGDLSAHFEYNIQYQSAAITKQAEFCLKQSMDSYHLLSRCLIPVCYSPENIKGTGQAGGYEIPTCIIGSTNNDQFTRRHTISLSLLLIAVMQLFLC